MTAAHIRTLRWLLLGIFVTASAACGGQDGDSSATATVGASGAQVQVGNTINYGSFGTTAEIDCVDGKSLDVGGSNNTLTVLGTCSWVKIAGADNKIVFDKVDETLAVYGLNNTVTIKAGDPQIDNRGQGNDVKKG